MCCLDGEHIPIGGEITTEQLYEYIKNVFNLIGGEEAIQWVARIQEEHPDWLDQMIANGGDWLDAVMRNGKSTNQYRLSADFCWWKSEFCVPLRAATEGPTIIAIYCRDPP